MSTGTAMTDRAAYRYNPPTYHGDVLFLRPSFRPSVVDPLPGWSSIVSGKLKAEDIDCYHEDLLDLPHIQSVASLIASHLAAAEDRES